MGGGLNSTLMFMVSSGTADSAGHWLETLRNIRQHKASGKRAPYKHLLLLWLIGRFESTGETEVAFKDAEIDPVLPDLIEHQRIGTSRVGVHIPFVYLGSESKLWHIRDARGRDVSTLPQNEKENLKYLRSSGVVGSLDPEFAKALGNQQVLRRVVRELLHSEFPESLHDGLLTEVGLPEVPTTRTQASGSFRRDLLRAYEQTCAFCEFNAQLLGKPVGLEAAHVRMRSYGGSDTTDNGVLLCRLHHNLFDAGALALRICPPRRHYRILVSEDYLQFSGPSTKTLAGKAMRVPIRGYNRPHWRHVHWHYENIFKQPARQVS